MALIAFKISEIENIFDTDKCNTTVGYMLIAFKSNASCYTTAVIECILNTAHHI